MIIYLTINQCLCLGECTSLQLKCTTDLQINKVKGFGMKYDLNIQLPRS